MTALEEWYASGGPQRIIPTIEISRSSADSIYLYPGQTFDDLTVTDEDGNSLTFKPSPVVTALRDNGNTGTQSLTFQFQGVTAQVIAYADAAYADGEEVYITYRAYLSEDLTAPAETPVKFAVTAVTVQGAVVEVTAKSFDLISAAFNRKRYRLNEYPGIQYINS